MIRARKRTLPRHDLDALRSAVSIVDALRAAGVDPPSRGSRIICPLHAGADNPSSFRFDERRFRCFACGARGDVFALVQALTGCAFSTALARVVTLSGGATGAPSIVRGHAQRPNSIHRRRQANLERWFTRWLRSLVEKRSRLRQQARRAECAMARERDQQSPDTLAWDELERAHVELAAAEHAVGLHEPENYEPPDIERWASFWLAEQSELADAEGLTALGQ